MRVVIEPHKFADLDFAIDEEEAPDVYDNQGLPCVPSPIASPYLDDNATCGLPLLSGQTCFRNPGSPSLPCP
jgi:hypothetical protein